MKHAPLTAYRVTLSDGSSYVTSMAAGVTLEQARAHFVGQPFEQANGSSLTAIDVQPVP